MLFRSRAFPGSWSPLDAGAFLATANTLQLAIPLGVLLVALRMRLARVAVSESVLELGRGLSPAGLRRALLQALGDPSLDVAFWHEGSRTYRDASDRPVALPDAEPTESRQPLAGAGHNVPFGSARASLAVPDHHRGPLNTAFADGKPLAAPRP